MNVESTLTSMLRRGHEINERQKQADMKRNQRSNFCSKHLYYIHLPTSRQMEKSVPRSRDRAIKAPKRTR